eukprot:scaffold284274_cov28-Tisochrysis_lutea.AAC.1
MWKQLSQPASSHSKSSFPRSLLPSPAVSGGWYARRTRRKLGEGDNSRGGERSVPLPSVVWIRKQRRVVEALPLCCASRGKGGNSY